MFRLAYLASLSLLLLSGCKSSTVVGVSSSALTTCNGNVDCTKPPGTGGAITVTCNASNQCAPSTVNAGCTGTTPGECDFECNTGVCIGSACMLTPTGSGAGCCLPASVT